jgi:pimeloyl-ACP methyl ester carboxylesterase
MPGVARPVVRRRLLHAGILGTAGLLALPLAGPHGGALAADQVCTTWPVPDPSDPARRRYATNDGVRLHYQVAGSGPPLVLLHGTSLSLADWYEAGYVDGLQQDYQLVLIDARGHGASDKPHEPEQYADEVLARDGVAVLDDLGAERAHVFGYSFGGRIALSFAEYAPSRLRSLIVGGQGGAGVTVTPQDAEQNRRAYAVGMDEVLRGWAPDIPPCVLTPDFRARMLANDPEALAASVSVSRPDLKEVFPTIEVPCLAYTGEDDPRPRVRAMAEAMPKGRYASLPGLNHWAGFYTSALVLPVVRPFLAEVG